MHQERQEDDKRRAHWVSIDRKRFVNLEFWTVTPTEVTEGHEFPHKVAEPSKSLQKFRLNKSLDNASKKTFKKTSNKSKAKMRVPESYPLKKISAAWRYTMSRTPRISIMKHKWRLRSQNQKKRKAKNKVQNIISSNPKKRIKAQATEWQALHFWSIYCTDFFIDFIQPFLIELVFFNWSNIGLCFNVLMFWF